MKLNLKPRLASWFRVQTLKSLCCFPSQYVPKIFRKLHGFLFIFLIFNYSNFIILNIMHVICQNIKIQKRIKKIYCKQPHHSEIITINISTFLASFIQIHALNRVDVDCVYSLSLDFPFSVLWAAPHFEKPYVVLWFVMVVYGILEIVMLREISQSEKYKYDMITLICVF